MTNGSNTIVLLYDLVAYPLAPAIPQATHRLNIQVAHKSALSPSYRVPIRLANQIDPFSRPVDHSSMQSSQTKPYSSRKSSGDVLPNAAIAGLNIPSIPGLSVEQVSVIMTAVQIAMDQAFDRHFGPLQQPNPTSPTPPPPTQPNLLAKQKRNQKTRN